MAQAPKAFRRSTDHLKGVVYARPICDRASRDEAEHNRLAVEPRAGIATLLFAKLSTELGEVPKPKLRRGRRRAVISLALAS